jgi:hypothetical protein
VTTGPGRKPEHHHSDLVCETKLVAALIEARLLSPLQADDRAELERCAGSV